ncbi:MAG: acyl-CoA dehydrogenase family protein [Alphaproteobacteria bacterium]
MTVRALHTSRSSEPGWRKTLAEIGPKLAEEGRRCDAAGEYAGANLAALRERGFFELAVPAEFGGAGLTRAELSDMLRELAHHCGSTALAFAMHTHVAAAAAWRWKHQKAPVDGLLKRIATERIQLLSSGGSDWLAGSGRAVKVDGGYRIDARKIFASGAPSANLFMTGAIEETPNGPTVLQFGIPMTAEGISIAANWDTLGMRGTASHDVVLDNVFVPDAAIAVRRESGPWHPLMHIISMVAIPLVYSVYAGVAEAARDIAIAAARKRPDRVSVETAGALDTELAATRMALASMVAFTETAQPSAETTNAIFMHRTLVSRSAIKTVDLALDLTGGASYFRTLGLERLFRDVQGARFHPLPEPAQRRLAGRMALGLPIDG